MEQSWYDSDIEDSDLDDDENEIRQLDAALEEAEIEVCDTNPIPVPAFVSRSCPSTEPQPSTSSTPAPAPPELNPDLQELSRLESTISINKQYDEKMRRLERILGLRLRECRVKLGEIQNTSLANDKQEVFRYINCGRPYFRDHNNFPAPDNPDAIMAKSEMYDFSLVTSVPGWTMRDKNQFTEVMIHTSLEIRKQQLKKQIKELKQLPITKKTQREIARLLKQRDSLHHRMPLGQLALPLDQEYDWDMLANKLNRRHTAHEYRCLWKLYFHPSINKSTWKTSEHNVLQSLASALGHQDWDEIASRLNTGRTGYQCFVYYRTNMTNSCIGKKWSHEEITYLRRLIDYFREDFYIPWGKIAAAMENRTKIQIYNKYLRLIEQRKGRFLPEEDAVILNCVERFGTNFRRMTEYLAHRSMVQIRSRYQVLNRMRVSTVWSVEDDRKLIQIMTNQDDSNTTFSNATKFFPGRNRINIRSRYVTLLKWMKRHPNLDIEHAPRRGARRLNHGQATEDLNKAIENLKNTLNTEVEIKRDRKKITRDSNEADIEDAIIATLVNEKVKELEMRKNAYEGSVVLPDETVVTNKELDLTNLRKCLIFLGSTLNQDWFNASRYSQDFPGLRDNAQDVSLFKVKSYSKTDTVKTIEFQDNPDIWGTCTLSPRNYVLPPHYATITGCKALMSYVSSFSVYCNAVNLHVLVRRNVMLKECMDMLLERFYTLFLWPLLLSNEGPSDFHNSKLCKIDSFYIRPPTLPHSPEVTIKIKSHKKLKNCDVSEQIDLSEGENQIQEITVQEAYEENDDVTDNIKNLLK